MPPLICGPGAEGKHLHRSATMPWFSRRSPQGTHLGMRQDPQLEGEAALAIAILQTVNWAVGDRMTWGTLSVIRWQARSQACSKKEVCH